MTQDKKTILVIEDEQDIREVYAEILRDSGYNVIEASDGEMGLKRALDNHWNLLLLDIMLPKRDGLEVLEEIKKDQKLSSRPVILLTNLGRESVIKEGFSLGAEGYIIKSEVTPDQIVSEVEKFLEAKE